MNSNIDGNAKFKDWGNQWFRRKKLDFSLSYAKTALNHLKNINSFIGETPISNIKIQDIDEFIIEFAEKNPHTGHPTAKSTLKDMRNIAASVFDFACDYEAINRNPAKGRKIPKKAPKTTRRALSKTEQKWIIETQHRMRLCALSMMLCGPRLGEIIPLTWYDLDFNTRLWTINKSVEKLENEYIVKPGTKNHKSRCVKAPVELNEELKIARLHAKSKYIFSKINGEMHTPSSFRSAWNSYLCKLNYSYGVHDDNITSIYNPHGIPFTIDRITPHMLRHTYATLLYSSDVDVLTASQLLGHSDINTTLNIYTHLEQMKFDKSIDKFDDFVSRMYSEMREPEITGFGT